MQGNFLTRIEPVWRISFYYLAQYFWSWLLLTIAQIFFFGVGVAAAVLGVFSLVGFDGAVIVSQSLVAVEQGTYGVISAQAILFLLQVFSYRFVGVALLLLGVFSFSYGVWLNFGVNRIAYALSLNGELRGRLFSELFAVDWTRFMRVILANALLFLIIISGLAVFILPGFFFMVRLLFVFPAMGIDPSITIRQAFIRSWQLTAVSWPLVLWFFIGFGFFYFCVVSFVRIFLGLTFFALARFVLFNHIVAISSCDA